MEIFQTVHEMFDKWDLGAEYSTDRRVYFQVLGQIFHDYGDLYIESYVYFASVKCISLQQKS